MNRPIIFSKRMFAFTIRKKSTNTCCKCTTRTSTPSSSYRSFSALVKTPYLQTKVLLTSLDQNHFKDGAAAGGGTVRQILPIGSSVRQGDVIALVRTHGPNGQDNGDDNDIPILAPQAGRITQWYATPLQHLALGEPLLELDTDSFLQQDDEQAWNDHLTLYQGLVQDDFLQSYLTLNNVGRLQQLVHKIREEWKTVLPKTTQQLYQRIVELQPQDTQPGEQAQTRTDWGVWLHHLGDLEGALEQFLLALRLRQQVYPSSHPHISASHFHLGAIYRQTNNPAKALEHMQTALHLQIQELGHSKHSRIAAGYNTVGAIHYQMGNYHEAKRNYETALEIHQQMDNNNQAGENADLAGTHHNLGVAFQHLGNFGPAEQNLQTALRIRLRLQEAFPQELSAMADVAASHYALGQLGTETGDLEVALPHFLSALDLQEHLFGKESPITAAGYNNIGAIHYQKQDFYAALKAYRKALNILEVVAPNHPDLAATYNNVGLAFYQLGEYEESLDHHTRSRRILEGIYGRDHPILANTIGSIGNALQSMYLYDSAMKEFKKAHSLLEEALGSEHPEIASSFNNMGLLWSQQGDHEQALCSYRSAARVFAKALGDNHPHTASCHFNMGLVLKSQGHLAKAKPEFQQAQKIWTINFGPDHPNVEMATNRIHDCESASTYCAEN